MIVEPSVQVSDSYYALFPHFPPPALVRPCYFLGRVDLCSFDAEYCVALIHMFDLHGSSSMIVFTQLKLRNDVEWWNFNV